MSFWVPLVHSIGKKEQSGAGGLWRQMMFRDASSSVLSNFQTFRSLKGLSIWCRQADVAALPWNFLEYFLSLRSGADHDGLLHELSELHLIFWPCYSNFMVFRLCFAHTAWLCQPLLCWSCRPMCSFSGRSPQIPIVGTSVALGTAFFLRRTILKTGPNS
jgi:hypothetical protein